MGIYSRGNKGHSHTKWFSFLPIPIPNCVINFHSRGIPNGNGIPIPMIISTTAYHFYDLLQNESKFYVKNFADFADWDVEKVVLVWSE